MMSILAIIQYLRNRIPAGLICISACKYLYLQCFFSCTK